MSVIIVLAIMFSVAYGVTAYLSRRESVVKARSQNEVSSDFKNLNTDRLLLFTAFWFQWFVIGFPFGQLANYVESVWIASLFDAINICSFVFMVVGAVLILCDEQLRKARLSLKLADYKLEFTSWAFGLIMCAFIIASMCV